MQPSALLCRDTTVAMHLHIEYPDSRDLSLWRRYSMRNVWLRLKGPGRVAVQSVFERPEEAVTITDSSWRTTQMRW